MTYGEVVGMVDNLVEDGIPQDEVRELIHGALLEHYRTPEGQEELMRSPHKNLRLTEAVDLLMQDVDAMLIRAIERREGGQ